MQEVETLPSNSSHDESVNSSLEATKWSAMTTYNYRKTPNARQVTEQQHESTETKILMQDAELFKSETGEYFGYCKISPAAVIQEPADKSELMQMADEFKQHSRNYIRYAG